VVLYSAEDDMAVMQLRLSRYMKVLGIDRSEPKGWLTVLDATECDNVLFAGDEKLGGRTTKRFAWLARQVEQAGAGVLIFDNASDAMDANENDRAKVRQFLSALKRVASAVLLLAHVDASSSMAEPGKAKGYSGSTAWHNSARSRWFMYRDDESDQIVLSLPKVNYSRAGTEAVIRWNDTNRLFEVSNLRDGRAKAADHREKLLTLLAAAIDQGRTVSFSKFATNSLLNTVKDMPGCPAGLKPRDVAQEVSRWLAEGLVKVCMYRKANRAQGEALELTAAGRAAIEETRFDDVSWSAR
jgi:hypothetical protein